MFENNKILNFFLSLEGLYLHPRQTGPAREVVQPGRIPGLGPGGRRFESCPPDEEKAIVKIAFFFCIKLTVVMIFRYIFFLSEEPLTKSDEWIMI